MPKRDVRCATIQNARNATTFRRDRERVRPTLISSRASPPSLFLSVFLSLDYSTESIIGTCPCELFGSRNRSILPLLGQLGSVSLGSRSRVEVELTSGGECSFGLHVTGEQFHLLGRKGGRVDPEGCERRLAWQKTAKGIRGTTREETGRSVK